MDSWEWNKIIGAVLGTCLFVLVVKLASESIFEVPPPAKPGYVVEGVQETASSGGAPAAPVEEALPDFGTVLPTASVSDGQQVAVRCQQCHNLDKGGPNNIGPNLWGIVGRARATHPGFDYSSAMMTSHEPWTYENLFRYLKSPATMVPGTKMSFAGLRSAQDRISLLAYLRTLADSPAPIPPPSPSKAAAPATTTAAAPSTAKSTAAPTPANGAAAPAAAGTKPAAAAPNTSAGGATTTPATQPPAKPH
ncbi:MAG: cytochrome c family protein [Rhizomicrobium sp.]|jgi:cytochrome c